MYAAIITLLAATSVIAAPVSPAARAETPNHYAEGYLEPYETYHSRYLSIGCSGQQGTQFFNDCCRPLLSTETVAANRPAYCAAGSKASPSASKPKSSSSYSPSPADESSSPNYSPSAAAVQSSAAPPADAAVAAANPVPTTTTSSAAPAETTPAQSSGGQSGGYQYTGGFATYFTQNGNAGACGIVHSDSELGIAIDGNGFWQNYGVQSEHCGKYINIKNTKNGKTVTAQVWDVCPTCTNDNSLDLSVGAFTAIATEAEGMVPIEWSWA